MSYKRKENQGCLHRAWIGWIRICRAINDFIELLFETHTRFITKNHKLVIVICLLFVAIMGIGGIRFNNLERNEELFIPQNSQAFKDLDTVEPWFRLKQRFEEIIVTADDGDVLNGNDALLKALELHEEILAISGFEKQCYRQTTYALPNATCNVTEIPSQKLSSEGECLYISIFDIFNYNKTLIQSLNATQINQRIREAYDNDFYLFRNGRNGKLNLANVLGSFKTPTNTTVSANAIRIVYYLNWAETEDEDIYDALADWEKEFLDLCDERLDSFRSVGLTLFYYAQRTRDDAVLQSTVGDLPFFSVAFVLMVGFCLVVFFNLRNPITGHLTVGILGICVIMLGIGTGFGLAMWIGTDFVAFTGILMFLILGIGMDNMFIIVDATESIDPDIQGPERLVMAMKHIGGSITMTTTTDLVAFAVSTVSDFPAVHLFCIYASLSIFFAYFMLITLFLAIMTADIHRLENGKRDVCWCCTAKTYNPEANQWEKQDNKFSKKILTKWGEFIMRLPVKIAVFFIACGLLAGGIYGTTQISQEFEWKKLGRDGSYFVDYADFQEVNFPAGYGVSVVLPPTLNYSDAQIQSDIVALDQIAIDNSRFESTTLNYMTAYRQWAAMQNITDISGDNFYCYLPNFLSTFSTFREDINFKSDSTIETSRVVFFYENDRGAINQADAMETIRDDLDAKSNLTSAIPISILFIYAEQFAAILDATIVNLAISAGAVLFITLPYLMHPGITGLVFLSFVSLLFELFGLMAAWDTSLDAIAMIVIIMAIGFSVDYTCHIAHAFMISKKNTPEKRVIDALSTMGTSVLNGGVSTFLGMLITGFSNAEGFRIFFRMLFGIVLLGLLHGLCFLPVLLSIFVRHDLRDDMKEFIDAHEESDRRRSERRISQMSENDKRRRSLSYRRQTSDTNAVRKNPHADKSMTSITEDDHHDHSRDPKVDDFHMNSDNNGVILTNVHKIADNDTGNQTSEDNC